MNANARLITARLITALLITALLITALLVTTPAVAAEPVYGSSAAPTAPAGYDSWSTEVDLACNGEVDGADLTVGVKYFARGTGDTKELVAEVSKDGIAISAVYYQGEGRKRELVSYSFLQPGGASWTTISDPGANLYNSEKARALSIHGVKVPKLCSEALKHAGG